nr:hypothetical protein [Streptomyces griseicoloratus]
MLAGERTDAGAPLTLEPLGVAVLRLQ